MFKKIDFQIESIYKIAKILKEKFPSNKITIKKEKNIITIIFLNKEDLLKIREIETFLKSKFPYYRFSFIQKSP
ncbi:MAG: hypothetical protein C4348_02095 [Patescibacteria group bacterium]